MEKHKILAIALLTRRDLEVIGAGLERVFPVEGLEGFADLLARLDRAGATDAPSVGKLQQ
jgi:hypothetical protein